MSTARDSPTEGSAVRVARGSTLSTGPRGVYHQGVSPSGAARTGFLQDWTHSSLFPALLQGILGKALRAHEPRKRRRAWEGHLQDTPTICLEKNLTNCSTAPPSICSRPLVPLQMTLVSVFLRRVTAVFFQGAHALPSSSAVPSPWPRRIRKDSQERSRSHSAEPFLPFAQCLPNGWFST